MSAMRENEKVDENRDNERKGSLNREEGSFFLIRQS